MTAQRPENFKFLRMVADSAPELSHLVEEIEKDYTSGRLRDQPWRWDQCHSWLEGWLYLYRRTHLHYEDYLSWQDEKVKCAVQFGPEFNHKIVGLLERLAGRLGPCSDLRELRLIGTRVTNADVARLQLVLPNARITKYSCEDLDANPHLSCAKG